MPHFENFDQYETTNPKSGKKKVIPIAPHSMQAVNYRPIKREDERHRTVREVEPPFKDVQVEPVSIRQMEKEFKQAARTAPKPRRRKRSKGLLQRIRDFLRSLLGKSPKTKRSKRRPRPSGEQRNQGRGKGKRRPPESQKEGQGNDGSRPPRKRRRRNRGRKQGKDGSTNQGGQNQDQGRPASKGQQSQKSEGGGPKKRSRRNRRRRPSGKPSQNPNHGGKGSGNSQSSN